MWLGAKNICVPGIPNAWKEQMCEDIAENLAQFLTTWGRDLALHRRPSDALKKMKNAGELPEYY